MRKMLKIAICDDDVKMTGRLDTVLEEIAKRNFVKIDTEVFLDGGELEKAEEIFMQGYNAANALLDQLKADQGTIWKDESNYQIIN